VHAFLARVERGTQTSGAHPRQPERRAGGRGRGRRGESRTVHRTAGGGRGQRAPGGDHARGYHGGEGGAVRRSIYTLDELAASLTKKLLTLDRLGKMPIQSISAMAQ
jgi:hypothetical protein